MDTLNSIFSDSLEIYTKIMNKYGLNAAIMISCIDKAVIENKDCSDNYYDNEWWVTLSIPEWSKKLPFMSECTIQRTFKILENRNLIIRGVLNDKHWIMTKSCRVNYEELKKLQ